MLTIFSTPKPFRGHSAIIQRNALRSWKLLHPDVEVILFGNEEGAAEICTELGLRHEPHAERTAEGTKYLNYLFHRAQKIARHDVVCYSNCDIILTQDFRCAVERVAAWRDRFLMVGRRWDTEITELLDFAEPVWQEKVRKLALGRGKQRPTYNVDYFVFRRGLYQEMPPLVVGRIWWDHWVVWKAGALKVPVVDASSAVVAIHQNHDYSYHQKGQQGVWYDPQANRNREIAGGYGHLHTIDDATYRVAPDGIRRKYFYLLAPSKRVLIRIAIVVMRIGRVYVKHPLLDLTRPIRHRLGLRRESIVRLLAPRRDPIGTQPPRGVNSAK